MLFYPFSYFFGFSKPLKQAIGEESPFLYIIFPIDLMLEWNHSEKKKKSAWAGITLIQFPQATACILVFCSSVTKYNSYFHL